MRILVLAPQPFFQNRGTPIATRQLLEVLSSQGHRLDVLTYHEGEDVQIPNCTIHRISRLPGIRAIPPGPSLKKVICDAIMFQACFRMLARKRWDVIHAVEESVFMALAMKRRFGIPFVYDMDSLLSRQMVERYAWLFPAASCMRAMERAAVRASVGVVAVCKSLEDEARSYRPDGHIVRVEDTSLINEDVVGDENLRDDLAIRGPMILYVGNLERYQGIDLLLEAFSRFCGRIPEGELVIIGGSPRDIRHYSDLASRLGVAARTRFIGPRPLEELGHYLRQADVLVSPRTQGKNTPMKIYSYLDSGKPILATRLPTHTQVLDDSIAFLVDPDPEAMALGLQTLLRDRVLCERLSRQARQVLQRDFNPTVLRQQLAKFYQDIDESFAAARAVDEFNTMEAAIS